MQVRISETYDLSTQVGKMGLVAIHTPSMMSIVRLWGGLVKNFKFFRFVNCDVTMACASMLPADPLQIGTEAGDIAPQDMFNPILYKAVSNDSFNNIVNRIMVYQDNSATSNSPSVVSVNNPNFGLTQTQTDFDLYYSLLADKNGWKKSMPQTGLSLKGLYPMVFSVLNTLGHQGIPFWKATPATTDDPDTVNTAPEIGKTGGVQGLGIGRFMRGPAMRMPRISTAVLNTSAPGLDTDDGTLQLQYFDVPPCYVAAMVLPPAKLNRLYYRLKVTWTIEFTEPRSLIEIMEFQNQAELGKTFYGTDYATQSKVASTKTSMVDTKDANVELVMEGA